KEEEVGLDKLGEGGKEVVSKIGEFGGDIGSELFGDRGGEVLFGGGEGGEDVYKRSGDKDDVYIEEFWDSDVKSFDSSMSSSRDSDVKSFDSSIAVTFALYLGCRALRNFLT
ncbi:hypothetical protein Tco_1542112, partial [Tanacetum coccineum]